MNRRFPSPTPGAALDGYWTRRRFLQGTAAAAATALVLPLPQSARAQSSASAPARFGLIADVHQDIMHDSESRLRAFVRQMKTDGVDFIAQLGDFCTPVARNQAFLDIWRSFPGQSYHTLGNHDMDGGATREQTVAFWRMPARYYAFDRGGLHFVVLDGNDPGPGQKPYYRYVGQEQAEWLARDLEAARLPAVLFTHQPLDHETGGVENHAAIRAILERANQASPGRLLACFSGHLHRDYARTIAGIHYLQVNSAAYFWIGSKFAHSSYGAEVEKDHPAIRHTVPYREPLWAAVTVDLARGVLTLQGRSSQFVGPSPWELGADRQEFDAPTVAASISDRRLRLG